MSGTPDDEIAYGRALVDIGGSLVRACLEDALIDVDGPVQQVTSPAGDGAPACGEFSPIKGGSPAPGPEHDVAPQLGYGGAVYTKVLQQVAQETAERETAARLEAAAADHNTLEPHPEPGPSSKAHVSPRSAMDLESRLHPHPIPAAPASVHPSPSRKFRQRPPAAAAALVASPTAPTPSSPSKWVPPESPKPMPKAPSAAPLRQAFDRLDSVVASQKERMDALRDPRVERMDVVRADAWRNPRPQDLIARDPKAASPRQAAAAAPRQAQAAPPASSLSSGPSVHPQNRGMDTPSDDMWRAVDPQPADNMWRVVESQPDSGAEELGADDHSPPQEKERWQAVPREGVAAPSCDQKLLDEERLSGLGWIASSGRVPLAAALGTREVLQGALEEAVNNVTLLEGALPAIQKVVSPLRGRAQQIEHRAQEPAQVHLPSLSVQGQDMINLPQHEREYQDYINDRESPPLRADEYEAPKPRRVPLYLLMQRRFEAQEQKAVSAAQQRRRDQVAGLAVFATPAPRMFYRKKTRVRVPSVKKLPKDPARRRSRPKKKSVAAVPPLDLGNVAPVTDGSTEEVGVVIASAVPRVAAKAKASPQAKAKASANNKAQPAGYAAHGKQSKPKGKAKNPRLLPPSEASRLAEAEEAEAPQLQQAEAFVVEPAIQAGVEVVRVLSAPSDEVSNSTMPKASARSSAFSEEPAGQNQSPEEDVADAALLQEASALKLTDDQLRDHNAEAAFDWGSEEATPTNSDLAAQPPAKASDGEPEDLLHGGDAGIADGSAEARPTSAEDDLLGPGATPGPGGSSAA